MKDSCLLGCDNWIVFFLLLQNNLLLAFQINLRNIIIIIISIISIKMTVANTGCFFFTGPTPKSSKCQPVSKCFQKKLEYLDWSPLKFLSVRTGPPKISKCLDWSPPFPLKSLSTGRLPFCKCKSFYTH